MLDTIRALTEDALAAPTPQLATHALHKALKPYGVSYLQARSYRRPVAPLTARAHWEAGGFVARHVRPDWIGSAAHRYICFDKNPLLEPIRRGMTRYRFSDFAPHGAKSYADYWDAMGEGGIGDALCVTSYGHARRIASFHIGFQRRRFAPHEAEAIQMAGLILTERFVEAQPGGSQEGAGPQLTVRERDVMALIADGKTDWEIGAILSVSEATARFHADNARAKLDATNRAHAVARFLALNGPI